MSTPEGQFVAPAELDRTVVVSNVQAGSQGATETAITSAFSVFGTIERFILQSDSDMDASTQHCVIVYATAEAARNSLSFDGCALLGAPVSVKSAAELNSAAPAAPAASGAALRSGEPSQLASLLASGYLAGQRGVASVLRMDREARVSERLSVATESAVAATVPAQEGFKRRLEALDEAHGITPAVTSLAESVSRSAREADERYQLSAQASAAAATAAAAARAAAARALEVPAVAQGVSAVSNWFSSFRASVSETYTAAQAEVARLQQEELAAAQAAQAAQPAGDAGATPAPSVPAAAEAGSAPPAAAGLPAAAEASDSSSTIVVESFEVPTH
jgi:hypothetical protein